MRLTVLLSACTILGCSDDTVRPPDIALDARLDALPLDARPPDARPPDTAPPVDQPPPNPNQIRLVYMVPSDRSAKPVYTQAMQSAALQLQHWFRAQTGGSTFTLHQPIVEIQVTPHAAGWYSSNANVGVQEDLWFWQNVLADGFALTGGKFDDPSNIWLFYIDADPACGQATGGTSHVALLPANDLRGLAGEANVVLCPGGKPDAHGTCRWVGGLGHEAGHALGLPHPADCDKGLPSCPSQTLMWLGYVVYPATSLLASDLAALAKSPFFGKVSLGPQPPACTL